MAEIVDPFFFPSSFLSSDFFQLWVTDRKTEYWMYILSLRLVSLSDSDFLDSLTVTGISSPGWCIRWRCRVHIVTVLTVVTVILWCNMLPKDLKILKIPFFIINVLLFNHAISVKFEFNLLVHRILLNVLIFAFVINLLLMASLCLVNVICL